MWCRVHPIAKKHYSRALRNWSNYRLTMRPCILHTFRLFSGAAVGLLLSTCPSPAAAQDTVVPQTALSTCGSVSIVSREEVTAGTGLAVSPDGSWLALYVHTNRGAEVTLRPRAGGETSRIELVPPALPGVTWRVFDAVFSPAADLLAFRSTSAIFVLDVAAGSIHYQIDVDTERQLYPGKISLAAGTLAVLFWPPESYLAEAKAKKGVELRMYEAATGTVQRTLPLALESSETWTEMELSPDASRIAILRRATRWPGKARLDVFATDSGKLLWEAKTSAEDFQWAADGKSIFALGGRLVMLDAAAGEQKSESNPNFGLAEFQKLRVSETANLVAGQFSRYSPFKRSLGRYDQRESMIVLWQLTNATPVCQASLPPSQSVESWITSQGEIITLEGNYELRPQLRLLKSAQIVTYRLAPK